MHERKCELPVSGAGQGELMAVTYLTLGQAAKEVGVSKASISQAIKTGRLSGGNKTSAGAYQIDPAELFRVYPPKQPAEPELTPLAVVQEAHQALLKSKDDRIEDLQRQLLEKDRDVERWYAQANNQLADQSAEKQERAGWVRRVKNKLFIA